MLTETLSLHFLFWVHLLKRHQSLSHTFSVAFTVAALYTEMDNSAQG